MTTPTADQPETPGVLSRILGWLEAGYPEGVPRTDRFALVALLKRRLTDDEVREIAHRLTADLGAPNPSGGPVTSAEPITESEIEELISHVLADEPSSEDIGRVSARLAAGGWPLAGAEDDEPTDPKPTTDHDELQETSA